MFILIPGLLDVMASSSWCVLKWSGR